MSLSPQFLDELRSRTRLSALVGKAVKLKKAGAEHKGCCPFHHEKTPSFTINDDKGFFHCFGCGAHGDAIRWLVDHDGLAFIDAVKQLAAAAGIEVPAPSPQAAAREVERTGAADVLQRAAAWYAEQLGKAANVRQELADRGVGSEQIAKFELGFAPERLGVAACCAAPELLEQAGLLIEDASSGLYRDRFRRRVMIPVHDPRGRLCGFSGRIRGDGEPKYLNNPESPHFAKGDLLFNLHRAAPAARKARRLILVEGHFDVIALDRVGIEEVVAPMGTALTDRQLERAWRVANCPILLLDGDAAGRKAALRAAEKAMPQLGPGASLSIATLPAGEDPDSLVRAADDGGIEGGRAAIEAVLAAARPLSDWLWAELLEQMPIGTPEGRAALWARLASLAGAIRDAETRGQYLAAWRARFDKAFPPPPPGLTHEEMLPDGSVAHVDAVEGKGRRRLRTVAAEWLAGSKRYAGDTPKKAGRWAWDLGRRVAAGLIDAETAEVALVDVEGELAKKLGRVPALVEAAGSSDQPETPEDSSIAKALDDFRRSYAIGQKRSFDLARQLLDMKCAEYERTDMGNAERWFARYGEDYLYTTAKGWLGWDGRRYRVLNQEKDTTPAEVLASVFATVRAIQDEAKFVRDTGWPDWEVIEAKALAALDEDPREPEGMDRLIHAGRKAERLSAKLGAWGRSSEASGRIGCIANLVKRWVTVELTEFDTDPMLLNCQNGTLRFHPADESGPARWDLKPHDRADRLTKITACDFSPDAEAPLFQKTVKWAQPDRGRRRYLRQWLGYNLTGDMGEQIFHIWYGPLAANGKSTVGNVCREAVGDYGDTTNVETFLDEGPKKHGDAATPAIVRLPGVRFLTAGEPPKGARINEPLINSVTGGDPMLARDNFRSFFRFLPIFKFTLWCNDLPTIPQGTAGIWRRVKVIPWEQHLKPEERDRDLPKKLQAEYAGVLAWMVRGLLDWMDHGFVEPESVTLASADYKQDSDPLSSFLRLCTAEDPAGRVQSSVLYQLFCAWAKAAGEKEWTQKGFSQALKAKGLATKASNGMHWLGIKTTKYPDDFVDSETGRVRNLDDLEVAAGRPDAPPSPPDDGDPFDDLPIP